MDIGLYRVELTKLAGLGGSFPAESTAIKYFRSGFVWLPARPDCRIRRVDAAVRL
jgi:hypothetical protein